MFGGAVDGALGASGEVPDEPGVHGSEEEVAFVGELAGAFDVVEHPFDAGCGEVDGGG